MYDYLCTMEDTDKYEFCMVGYLLGNTVTDNGSVVEVFTDLSVWLGIKRVIDNINSNAVAA